MNDFSRFCIGKSRALDIQDGFLIDVSELAKEIGFVFPVAVTLAAWSFYIDWTNVKGFKTGRLWSILCEAQSVAYSRDDEEPYRIIFEVFSHSKDTCHLKMICGPGDLGEPVITISLPHED